jgi:hypothetical protein
MQISVTTGVRTSTPIGKEQDYTKMPPEKPYSYFNKLNILLAAWAEHVEGQDLTLVLTVKMEVSLMYWVHNPYQYP